MISRLGRHCLPIKYVRRYSQSSKNIQYTSDLHVDTRPIGYLPKIHQASDHLAICGDLGNPKHPNFRLFVNQVSKQFKKVFIVPGNHDLGCNYHQPIKANYYQSLIQQIVKDFPNVHYLNQSVYPLDSKYLIAGTILWSHPLIEPSQNSKYEMGINEHHSQVRWIEKILKEYSSSNIIMLTHYVPTFRLIEKKYLIRGLHQTSWFATNLEYLIKDPIYAWLCGHSHSVIDCKVNGIYCGINAYGYQNENQLSIPETKLIELI